jgi:hypothetical protein
MLVERRPLLDLRLLNLLRDASPGVPAIYGCNRGVLECGLTWELCLLCPRGGGRARHVGRGGGLPISLVLKDVQRQQGRDNRIGHVDDLGDPEVDDGAAERIGGGAHESVLVF